MKDQRKLLILLPAAYFTTVRFLAAVHVQVSLEILLHKIL